VSRVHCRGRDTRSVQVKRAIEKGNIEGARIYAQNAIRKKTETLNYLKVRLRSFTWCRVAPVSRGVTVPTLPGRGCTVWPRSRTAPPLCVSQLGSRLDAVVSRLETQAKMNVINKSFAGIVRSLDRALASNNLQQVSVTMDQFERQFENLDVQSECVEAAMSSSMALSTPQEQVDSLMQQVADEHNLTLALDMPAANKAAALTAPQQALPASPGDDLSRRLAELKAR